jgi:hypothetical protein
MGNFAKARELMEEMERLQTHDGTTGLLRESMLMDFDNVHAAMMRLPWRFAIAAPGRYFVTTDSPVVFDRHQGLRNSPLMFPLSSSVILDAWWMHAQDLAYAQLSVAETRHLNAMVISQSDKVVYSPRPDQWVQDGATNGFQFVVGVDAEENISPGAS